MGPFLKRYRELLVSGFLLVLPLVVYASHAGKPSMPGMLRSAVVWVTSPVQKAIVTAVSGAQDLWYGYVDLRDVRVRSVELQARMHRLRAHEERLVELEAENVRLRRLVGYAEAVPELRLVAATVVGQGVDPKVRSLRLDRGASAGLRPGMPVVCPDGVVGRLSHVYETASDVLLITDPSSAVAVTSQRTRARASAAGTGQPDRLRLDYLVRGDSLETGDILVTASSGGLFPRGLRIGRASAITEPSHGLFKSAELVPSVDFSRLEEVQIVLDAAPSASLGPSMNALLR